MADERTELFLRLSAALTGVHVDSFSRVTGKESPAKPGDLKPRHTTIDLTKEFFEVLDGEDGVGAATVDSLLNAFKAAAAGASDFDAAGVLFRDDKTFGPLCRSIMKLWYLGVWYSPQKPKDAVKVVSSQAYKEGLVWQVMQAHPVGYSMSPFGHWSAPPPPLDAFITLNDE